MSIDILKGPEGSNARAYLWAPIHEIESSALAQIKNVISLPWLFQNRCAIMADVHAGIGCTIGSVVPMTNAVSPALCGVDIGCGVNAIKTNLKGSDLPDDLGKLRHSIERGIPVGRNWHKEAVNGVLELPIWKEFDKLSEKVQKLRGKAVNQCGSLGSGNHYIEVCLDTDSNVWLMLHSGSRNIGKELAEIHIEIAKKLSHNSDLPDPDLAVFLSGTPQMDAYRRDLYWAQRYAAENRRVMMDILKDQLRYSVPKVQFEEEISCHHNYVAEEYHYGEKVFVTRKGAIHAGKGVMGLIPGSMGTKSYVVRGLGNPESLDSAPHGAGRRMSRGEAKRRFTQKDLEEQTAGVECRKDAGVIDEIPGAYKNIDDVIENSKTLVEVVAQLKQVMCIKG